MAPKNNAKGGDKKGAAAKGKGKDAGDDKGKVKGAQSINVRHILVSIRLIHRELVSRGRKPARRGPGLVLFGRVSTY